MAPNQHMNGRSTLYLDHWENESRREVPGSTAESCETLTQPEAETAGRSCSEAAVSETLSGDPPAGRGRPLRGGNSWRREFVASGAVISRRAKRGVIHLWLGFSFCLASAFFLAHVFWLLIPASDAEGGASKLFFCFFYLFCVFVLFFSWLRCFCF